MKAATYLEFHESPWPLEFKRKTRRFEVLSKSGAGLGIVFYQNTWRKYVFEPFGEAIYDSKCLDEISAFLDGLQP